MKLRPRTSDHSLKCSKVPPVRRMAALVSKFPAGIVFTNG
jgi:hypothetical protein